MEVERPLVTNYTCNSQLGSDSDILTLKEKLNSMGLMLMLVIHFFYIFYLNRILFPITQQWIVFGPQQIQITIFYNLQIPLQIQVDGSF